VNPTLEAYGERLRSTPADDLDATAETRGAATAHRHGGPDPPRRLEDGAVNLNKPERNNQMTQRANPTETERRLDRLEAAVSRHDSAIYSLAALSCRLGPIPRVRMHEALLEISREQGELHGQAEADRAERLQQVDQQRKEIEQERRLAPEEVVPV